MRVIWVKTFIGRRDVFDRKEAFQFALHSTAPRLFFAGIVFLYRRTLTLRFNSLISSAALGLLWPALERDPHYRGNGKDGRHPDCAFSLHGENLFATLVAAVVAYYLLNSEARLQIVTKIGATYYPKLERDLDTKALQPTLLSARSARSVIFDKPKAELRRAGQVRSRLQGLVVTRKLRI